MGEKKKRSESKMGWNFTPIFMKQKLDVGKEFNFPLLSQLQRQFFLPTFKLAGVFICVTCPYCSLLS